MPKLSITGTLIPPTDCGRVDPGIGPAVIEFGGIRLFADAGRIRDNQEDTLKLFHLILILCGTNPLTIHSLFSLAIQIISAHDALARDLGVNLGGRDVGVPSIS
jgi:hypothetical protein